MPKELRIEATISVPDDLFAQAEELAALKPAIDHFRAAVEKHSGTMTCALVTPRAAKSGE